MSEPSVIDRPAQSDGKPAKAPKVPPATELVGVILRVDGAKVTGWARDPTRPGAPVDLELVVDGVAVDRALANAAAPEAPAGETAGEACGFTLKAPPQLRTGRELHVRVRATGTELFLADSFTTRLFGGLKSKLSDVHDGVARGWASNPFAPDELPEVEVSIDGAPFAVVRPTLVARDPARKRFEARIPADVQDGEEHQVSARWAGTTVELPGSPVAWRAPEPRRDRVHKITERDAVPGGRPRPPYALPRTETAPAQDLMARAALTARLPGAVKALRKRLDKELARGAPGGGARTRVDLFLSASSLRDLEVAFSLGQLLAIMALDVHPYVLLASDEAVAMARELARDAGLDQLVRLVAVQDLWRVLDRLPVDDLVAFLPARTAVLPAFEATVGKIAAGETDAVVGACAALAIGAESLIWAEPLPHVFPPGAPVDLRDAAAVGLKGALLRRLDARHIEFEGVGLDEFTLRATGAAPLAARLEIARPPLEGAFAPGRSALAPLSIAEDLRGQCAGFGAQLTLVAPLEEAGNGHGRDVLLADARTPADWQAIAGAIAPGAPVLVLLNGGDVAPLLGAASFGPNGPSRLARTASAMDPVAHLDDLASSLAEAAAAVPGALYFPAG